MARCPIRIRHTLRLVLILLLVGMPSLSPLRAQEYRAPQQLDACDMVIETLICRPAGLVATLIGATVWAVSLPFSLAGGNEKEARKALIYEPAAYTFKRPVGTPECSCGGYLDPQ